MHPSKRAQFRLNLGSRLRANDPSAESAFAPNVTNITAYFPVSFLFAKRMTPIILRASGIERELANTADQRVFRWFGQKLYEIVRGKNFALNCLSWKFIEMIMITNEVIAENLVVVR